MKKASKAYVWVEEFRPDSISSTILPMQFKKFFNKIIEDGEIPNLLLYSATPGSGKTTVAKALCRDLGIKPLYINISAKGGIDTLRTDIERHATTMSLNGKHKVVILDEFDGASHQLQAGLRAFIEEYHKSCRFIITCNYVSKIIPALREGRCMEFDFDMTDSKIVSQMKPKILKRLETILKAKEIDCTDGVLEKVVDKYYPSIREMLSVMQKYYLRNGIIDANILNEVELGEEFYQYILTKKLTKAREYIIENSINLTEMYVKLGKEFVPLIEDGQARAQAYIILADYGFKHVQCIDPEINFAACLVELMSLL